MSEDDLKVVRASLKRMVNDSRSLGQFETLSLEAATILKLVEANAKTRR